MFVRTRRLTLRPGWPEDAPELAQAIGHEAVVRNLSRAPWPYALGDAQQWLARERGPVDMKFVICAHEGGATRIVGAIGLEPAGDGAWELGYFLTPDVWRRGYATEAGLGVLAAARAQGVRQVTAGYFFDNPASGHVLRKLGLSPTGEIRATYSRGRGCEVDCIRFAGDLTASGAARVNETERAAA